MLITGNYLILSFHVRLCRCRPVQGNHNFSMHFFVHTSMYRPWIQPWV